MARKLSNFIDGFVRYTEGRGSPRIFRLWTAIFMIGAVLERKVWATTVKGRWYPNQYILLCGGAGVGKSLCTSTAYDLLEGVRSPERPYHIAPTSVTKASLIDALHHAERRVVRPLETPSVNQFNSLTVVANEFGVFLPSWEGDFMGVLTDLWDCKRYAETRRTRNIDIEMPNTQLNILSADTPSHLNRLLPEGAWEEGFMSRMLVVYSGDAVYVDLFAKLETDEELYKDLQRDLIDMYGLWGEISFSEDAERALHEWARAGGPPIPDHPKLYYYNTRRLSHLLTLCIVASVSEKNDLIVTLDNFAEALDWLIELESHIPEIFKSMRAGGDKSVLEDCYHFVYQIWVKEKKPIAAHRLWHYLQERTPTHKIEWIITAMVKGGILEEKVLADMSKGYVPKGKG